VPSATCGVQQYLAHTAISSRRLSVRSERW
jgi:hypothetical protein